MFPTIGDEVTIRMITGNVYSGRICHVDSSHTGVMDVLNNKTYVFNTYIEAVVKYAPKVAEPALSLVS